jgi:hypothetical protein
VRYSAAALALSGWVFALTELFAEYDDFLRRTDPQFDAVSLHAEDPDEDVAANDNRLIDLTG